MTGISKAGQLARFFVGGRREVDDDPLLSVTQDKGVTLQEGVGRRNISSADKASYWRAYAGDIVYNTMRMWQGASACSRYFGIVSPAYTVCEPVDGANADYISYLFKLPENMGNSALAAKELSVMFGIFVSPNLRGLRLTQYLIVSTSYKSQQSSQP